MREGQDKFVWLLTRPDPAELTKAQDPSSSAAVLEQLYRSTACAVRQAVAAHPNTPQWALVWLSDDVGYEVRSVVASNPRSGLSTLSWMAEYDEEPDVRAVAQQTLTSLRQT